ncbi:nucleotidyltransferase domain-containing protein [Streptomyces sp. b94]|uniref:nucleotidyltransferase domain-containing protein n=1 Tax=Streptomyces sp. b94 TaxID=1827634 RepID=UPI001B395D2C|nr:nucleotidyltransferase domain-containing protein [Streptomyces sp. b94]MBQ1099695.1 nucleotidyltransferase domain-containing protein [Streptomyces sp. b94]
MPTDALLDRFLTSLRPLTPLAVWAHGSLAGGDYQEGRSDLDLIAVLDRPVTLGTAWRLGLLHARLRAEPLAPKLHCTYLSPGTVADSGRPHLTWAHEELYKRPVTPVTRSELTKRQALAELRGLDAPDEVVADIEGRRYGNPAPPTAGWTARRCELTRSYLGPAIDTLVASYS